MWSITYQSGYAAIAKHQTVNGKLQTALATATACDGK
jgi:hypothetical protein